MSYEDAYINWLTKEVKKGQKKDYGVLLKVLWHKEFHSILPNDDNREQDGRDLRIKWCEEQNIDLKNCDFGPCKVLEMLISLSKIFEFELNGSQYNKHWVDLFWEMLDNLELLQYDTQTFIANNAWLDVDTILNKWLDRRFNKDGFGSIFPLKSWESSGLKSQRRVEIWYQLCNYLLEKYPI